MARVVAKLTNRTAARCLTTAIAFALFLYGHQVLSSAIVFGAYMMLCLFAVAIVFHQTRVTPVPHRVVLGERQRLDRKGSQMYWQELSSELGLLQREYNEDVKRLERKWL